MLPLFLLIDKCFINLLKRKIKKMNVEAESENNDKIWKKFLSKHFKMFVLFVVSAILAFMGIIYILLWFVEEAQLTGLIPETLNLWTMGYLVTFLLHLIFWIVILIGIPVIIAIAAVYFLWWKKLPDDERQEYNNRHLFGKRSNRSDAGGVFSFFINIGFIIKVNLDGNWNEPFADWTFDYLVYSYITASIWVLLIFGIPIAIGGTWWIFNEM